MGTGRARGGRGAGDEASAAHITHGTAFGLDRLLDMVVEPAGVAPEQGLVDRLKSLVADAPAGVTPTVTVTGHSLGGALAPTLALWLADERGRWSADRQVRVWSVALAGPTPGNAAFADRVSAQLGADAWRIVNPLDVVPRAWADVRSIADMYDDLTPPVRLGLLERGAVDVVSDILARSGLDAGQYAAPARVVTLPATPMPDTTHRTFAAEVGWQHTDAYELALGFPGLRNHLQSVADQAAPPPS